MRQFEIPGANSRFVSWKQSFGLFVHPRVITMLFLGFSAGIPLLLIFSSLSLWLREAGVERSAVTFFSWAALAYSFKFVWAPLVDCLPIPVLTNSLGRRRAWLLFAQIAVAGAIVLMALVDPSSSQENLLMMAWAAVFLGFSSATQDIVIDAYRIESAESSLQAMMSSSYIAGYRVGMIVSGAGALFLANEFGTSIGAYDYSAWRTTYLLMATVMLVGVVTTLIIDEPAGSNQNRSLYSAGEYTRLVALFLVLVACFVGIFFQSAETAAQIRVVLSESLKNQSLAVYLVAFGIEVLRLAVAVISVALVAFFADLTGVVNRKMVRESYIEPVLDFFQRFGLRSAILLLALIGLYRISDIVLGVISNVFFQDMGFSKTEIASVVKTFGLIMTLVGGFLGGMLTARFGVMRILFLGGILTVLTNLLFMIQASAGHDVFVLYCVISADNLSAGLASAAFIAFLSGLTNVSFTAMQYAIFSSLMTFFPKVLGGYSGTMVEAMGYSQFFLVASIMGLPVLGLIWMSAKVFDFQAIKNH